MEKAQRNMNNPGIIPFDPLEYVKRLESVGFTREQAEVQAETFFVIAQEHSLSKQDLKEAELGLKKDLKETELELRKDLLDLKSQMKEFKLGMTQQFRELEINTTQQTKELDAKTTQQFKELDTKTMLMGRDLKIWVGGMLGTLTVILSSVTAIFTHINSH
jgi:hypothetical protein